MAFTTETLTISGVASFAVFLCGRSLRLSSSRLRFLSDIVKDSDRSKKIGGFCRKVFGAKIR